MTQKTCPCCASQSAKCALFFNGESVADSSWGVPSGERTIFRCIECGLQYSQETKSSLSPEEMYSQQYHDVMSGEEGWQDQSGAREQAALRKDLIADYCGNGRLLDVGCSTGLFIKVCQEKGFACYGIDPSPYACQKARESSGLQEISVEVASIATSNLIKSEQFDVITMWDVIEHCSTVASDMKSIVKAMKPGGFIFLRTPDSASIFFALSVLLYKISFGKINYPVASMYHFDHYLFFNRVSITKFLESNGLRVVRVTSDPLLWKRFKYAECRRSLWVNMVLSLLYWVGRVIGHGHGMIVVARKEG